MQLEQIQPYLVSAPERGGVHFGLDLSITPITVAGATLELVGQFVDTDPVGFFIDSDLGVLWVSKDLTETEINSVMAAFANHDFDQQLRTILQPCGFSEAALASIEAKPLDQQVAGRASFTGQLLADEIRTALGITQ